MKTKTYNFGEFMRGQHEFKKPKELVTHAIVPGASAFVLKSMFLHNGGILIVAGVGIVTICLAYAEQKLAGNGNVVGANNVNIIGKLLLPTIGYTGIIVLLGHLVKVFGVM